MSCEICGRYSCSRSFHSLEEQEEFDSVADDVKARFKYWLENQIGTLYSSEKEEEEDYIKRSEVIDLIHSYN